MFVDREERDLHRLPLIIRPDLCRVTDDDTAVVGPTRRFAVGIVIVRLARARIGIARRRPPREDDLAIGNRADGKKRLPVVRRLQVQAAVPAEIERSRKRTFRTS